jgi:hypothetical protein
MTALEAFPVKHLITSSLSTSLGILGLALVLSSCTVRGSVPVEVFNFTYQSNLQDRSGRYIICDNLETRLVYSFDYLGYLGSWESVLIGEETGEERGRVRLTPPQPESGRGRETITLTYTLLPRSAPLSLAEDLMEGQVSGETGPSSIIVEPIPGPSTRVELTIRSLGGYSRTFVSPSIPVLPTC